MRNILTIILFLAGLNSFGQGKKLVDEVAAIVGDKIILMSDIELQYQQMQMDQQDVPDNLKCALLDGMLMQKMLLEQAQLDSIVVSEDEIEQELNRRIKYFVSMIGSEQKLEEYYEKSIIEIKDEFRRDIEEQLLSNRMRSEVLGSLKVSPAEVKSFFNNIPEDSLPYFNAEVEVAQIVIYPQVDKVQKQLAIEKLEGIRERIVAGEDFYTLAMIYSEDPGSVEQGGDLGFVGRGELVTEFEAAAFRLEENEVSPIVKTQFGYHVLQLLERKGEKVRIRHILIKPKITSFDLAIAKERLDSIRNIIVTDSMSFAEAASIYSEDESTKHQGGSLVNQQTGNTFFEIEQLDQSVYFAIEDMEPGDISAPVFFQTQDGRQAYRIIKLKSETEAHQANLKDDYNKIKAAAAAKKEEKELEDWLTDKINETYVFIENSYLDCSNLQKWINKETTGKTYE